jgi:hypothetical protein
VEDCGGCRWGCGGAGDFGGDCGYGVALTSKILFSVRRVAAGAR